MSNQKNQTSANAEANEKKMTKYDRKVQARKEAADREKRQRTISRITAVAVLVIAVLIIIAVPITKRVNAKKEYFRIGEHSVNKIEYNFYFNTFTSYARSMYTYFGMIDSSKALSEQAYSENKTWQQFFDEMTVENLVQCFALADDAKAKGLTYDVASEITEFYDSLSASAQENEQSLSQYLKDTFGAYASKSTLEDALTVYLTAGKHNEYLLEQNKPSEDEVTAYYNENKNNYDTVNYQSFEVAAEVAEDASEDDIKAAMEKAKAAADEFKARLDAGEAFTDLYNEYNKSDESTEDEDTDADTEENTDPSLHENTKFSSADTAYRDWLFDEKRAPMDSEVISDEAGNSYHIVSFLARTCPEDTNETISDTLASNAVSDYITPLYDNYPLNDSKDHLNLASIQTEDAE